MNKTSFMEQMENNTTFNLLYPYHIRHEKLRGDLAFSKKTNSFHCHSFEDVLYVAYAEPLAFYLTHKDLPYYSSQELEFISKVVSHEVKKIERGRVFISFNVSNDFSAELDEFGQYLGLGIKHEDALSNIMANPIEGIRNE